jgi:putative addiction module killer protein
MVRTLRVEIYEDGQGRQPFHTWLYGLRDAALVDGIRARLTRVGEGNLGDYRDLSGGLCELRIFRGPGYRLYFTWASERVVLLLSGGTKRSQASDIARARRYLRDYWERQHGS